MSEPDSPGRDRSRLLLGDVATVDIDRVRVVPAETYNMAGVYNQGQGVFERGPIQGCDTSYTTLHRLSATSVVMRKLTGWEGSIAVVGPEHAGMHVSTEFPTFRIDTNMILPAYMALLCQWPVFWEEMKLRATGTVQRRKRVNPDALLAIPIDLPATEDQARVVDLIGSVDVLQDTLGAVLARAESVAARLRQDHFASADAVVTAAGDFFQITMGRQRSPRHADGDHLVPYLRSANVKDGRLVTDDVKTMNFTPMEQEKFSLAPGDVLISEGCGSLEQLGASAQWDGEIPGVVCFQNTLLRVRARPGVSLPGYAMQWARHAFESDGFSSIASGTNIFHIGAERAAVMPVSATSLDEQQRFLALVSVVDRAAAEARRTLAAAEELRGALLADLLSGGHEIPASYDDLLGAV